MNDQNIYFLVIITLFGLAIGSFINVVIYRLPRKLSLVKGRSQCTSCQRALKWYHNIPDVSYLALRGACGYCGDRISWQYPLVEVLNSIGYCYYFWQYGFSVGLIISWFLVSVLLAIFFIDLKFQIIPDEITLSGIVIGLATSLLPGGIGIMLSLLGLLVGGGFLFLMGVLGDLIFKRETMGGGDIKMTAMLGVFLGWQDVLFVIIVAATIGLVITRVMKPFSGKIRKSREIPFGPFLALATIVVIEFGHDISAYISTMP